MLVVIFFFFLIYAPGCWGSERGRGREKSQSVVSDLEVQRHLDYYYIIWYMHRANADADDEWEREGVIRFFFGSFLFYILYVTFICLLRLT